jgi:transposase
LYAGVKRIGIDEIALRKGHKDFVAVIVNLDTHEVLDLLENRTKAELVKYFKEKGAAFCASIEVFCSDMWDGYIETAKELFVNADIIVDRFHFFMHLQKVVDAVRKKLRKDNPKQTEFKKIKWLFLKNAQDLSDKEKQQMQQLWTLPECGQLKQVYEMKNSFQAILEQNISIIDAQAKLQKWITQATNLGIDSLNKFVEMFGRWEKYILNYFKHRLSTGLIEGINNKIKLIKRRAYGFASFHNFRRVVLNEFLKS